MISQQAAIIICLLSTISLGLLVALLVVAGKLSAQRSVTITTAEQLEAVRHENREVVTLAGTLKSRLKTAEGKAAASTNLCVFFEEQTYFLASRVEEMESDHRKEAKRTPCLRIAGTILAQVSSSVGGLLH